MPATITAKDLDRIDYREFRDVDFDRDEIYEGTEFYLDGDYINVSNGRFSEGDNEFFSDGWSMFSGKTVPSVASQASKLKALKSS